MRIFLTFILCSLFIGCTSSDQKEGDQNTGEYIKEPVLRYYDNGKLKMEGTTVNGKAHGEWRFYYENGYLWSVGRFRHGVREGRSIVYFENGKKRMQGNYHEGERSGWWQVWYEDGNFADSINLEEPLQKRDSLLLGY